MRKIITLFILFISFSLSSQISSLAELASGEIQLFNPIFEIDNSIYGYFMVVKLDDVSENEQKFEYILLDKNLNKVANGEFLDRHYKKYDSEFITPEKVGEKILLSKIYYRSQLKLFSDNAEYKFVSNRTLDLSTNKISSPFYFENDLLIEGERESDNIDNNLKENVFIQYPFSINGGYLLYKKPKLEQNSFRTKKIATLEAYSINNKKSWQYNYNPEEDFVTASIEFLNENVIVLSAKNLKTKSQVLHFINPKTGKASFKYELENKKSKHNHLFKVRTFKDKTVIVGMTSKNKSTGFNYKKATGLFKIELDNNGNETFKKYFEWENAGP